jgi:hypothetical protein
MAQDKDDKPNNDLVQLLTTHKGTIRAQVSVAPATVSLGEVNTVILPKSGLKEWLQQHMEVYPPLLDLPDDIRARIGEIITRWSYAEWMLADVMNKLHGLDRKLGRQADKMPRLKDLKDRIPIFLNARGITYEQTKWSTLTALIDKCDETRNQLSHSIWFKDANGNIGFQDIRDSWPGGKEKKVSKREYPGRVYTDAPWFLDRLAEINKATQMIEELHGLVPAP